MTRILRVAVGVLHKALVAHQALRALSTVSSCTARVCGIIVKYNLLRYSDRWRIPKCTNYSRFSNERASEIVELCISSKTSILSDFRV